MTNSLFNISSELATLRDIATYDEITPELEEQLTIKEEELGVKLIGYTHIISEMDVQLSLAQKEVNRIVSFMDKLKKAEERLQYNMLQALLEFGEPTGKDKGVYKLQIGTNTFSTQRSKRTIIENESELPDEYYKYKVTIKDLDKIHLQMVREALDTIEIPYEYIQSIIKTDIKKDITNGKTVPGASVETYYSLKIK